MSKRYMPRPDGDFATFASNFVAAAVDFYGNNELDPELLDPLKLSQLIWNNAYPAHVAAQAAAEAARQKKTDARIEFERQIRPIASFIQTYPKTTDADRATMGITIRQPSGGRVPPPVSRPIAQVEAAARLTHTLRISDNATPTRKARPKNTLGAEVRGLLIPPGSPVPTDPELLRFISLATSGTATATYPPDAGGKLAVYMLRWIGPRGAVGPWSDVCTATVAA